MNPKNNKMLEKLSKEQERLMYEHRHNYIDFIVNNEKYIPDDLELTPELREDVNWVYKKAGLKTPDIILVAKSYLEEKLMINCVFQMFGEEAVRNQVWDQVRDQVKDQVARQVWDHVWNQVNDQVYDQVSSQVFNQVRDQVENQVSNQVRNHVWNQVWNQVVNHVWNQVNDQVSNQVFNQVRDQVRGQVRDQVENQVSSQVNSQVSSKVRNQVWNQVVNHVWNQVRNQVSSQVENQVEDQVSSQNLKWVEQYFGLPCNSWFSFYSYFEKIDIVSSTDFSKYYGLMKNHGLWSIQFFENWCIVTQLPRKITRDVENRLHNTDGPSIEWRNGEKNHYIHGVYFESGLWEQVVSGKADPQFSNKEENIHTILKIQNQEQKQAALSVVPLKLLLEKTNAVLIDSYSRRSPPPLSKKYVPDYNSLDYSKPINLYEIDGNIFDIRDENIKIVHYFDPSTGREYFDFVPPEITRASQAMAWKFGVDEEDYINGFVVET